MQTKGRNIHRGALLEAAVNDRHVNITQMVKRMGISRGTYYNHINDPALPYEQLDKYGKAIGHDFTDSLPEMKRFLLEEPEAAYKKPKTFEEAVEQLEAWREKYYGLMEKYLLLKDKQQESENDKS